MITGPKRHSMHKVGLLQTSAQIVSIASLSPEMGARFRFLASRPLVLPPGWLCFSPRRETSSNILALQNNHTPGIWICDLCHKPKNKPQSDGTTHTLCSSEMHTFKTKTVHTRLEMHHSDNDMTMKNNLFHIT